MSDGSVTVTPSGVRIEPDFRNNLIIDRYDPVFTRMRGRKQQHLCSENSEYAATWNVFRTLRQIDPEVWLLRLCELQNLPRLPTTYTTLELWVRAALPPSLLSDGDEGDSEIDVVIQAPNWVWFIAAKYRSDVSLETKVRSWRDQVIRNIDVGSHYAGVRDFYFSLLIHDEKYSKLGVELVRKYADLETTRAALADHRPDELPNLGTVRLLTWQDLGIVLCAARDSARHADERAWAARAVKWLTEKRLFAS